MPSTSSSTFRKDIAQMKPAMAIAEGQFSDVGSYNIKVEKKEGENGNHLKGVTIHKKAGPFEGSRNVIKARTGELVSNEKSNILKLVLNDGYYYEDLVPKKLRNAKNTIRQKFVQKIHHQPGSGQTQQRRFGRFSINNTNTMLNINELRYTLDSLNKSYKRMSFRFQTTFTCARYQCFYAQRSYERKLIPEQTFAQQFHTGRTIHDTQSSFGKYREFYLCHRRNQIGDGLQTKNHQQPLDCTLR
jgi:hypothetical protein